jgi:hypothetical protein
MAGLQIPMWVAVADCCCLFSKPKVPSAPGISILDGTPDQSSSSPLLALLALLIVEFLPLLSTKSIHLNSYHAVPAAFTKPIRSYSGGPLGTILTIVTR